MAFSVDVKTDLCITRALAMLKTKSVERPKKKHDNLPV
jgi:hypothetical protein